MATETLPIGQDMLREALSYMESALELLDRAQVSAHIGAHLDLAICELQSAMGLSTPVPDRNAIGGRPH
jgi:hypothetical protein